MRMGGDGRSLGTKHQTLCLLERSWWYCNGNLLRGHVVIWVLAGMDEVLVVARAEC